MTFFFFFCRYLGQLLGATDEADELLCKGIDILKQDVVATVRSCGCESIRVPDPMLKTGLNNSRAANLTSNYVFRLQVMSRGHQKMQQSLLAHCHQLCAALLSYA